MSPEEYKPSKIHTYSDMIREALLYLCPTLDREKLYTLTKSELRELYCHAKNNGTNSI